MDLHIGHGWDSHRLVADRPLILGGTEIPHDKGLLGHSDADALLHAVIDALFGAAALGDIGMHYPDHDPAWLNISSLRLLDDCRHRLDDAGWSIVNIDSTIIAQQPRLAPYTESMRDNIAATLRLPRENISVKCKTAEGMDSVGAGLAIQAQAIALITRN